MTAADVIDLYSELEHLGIAIWADGGWGVDALLGQQTRTHSDLDIVVEQKHLPKVIGIRCTDDVCASRAIEGNPIGSISR